MTLHRFFLPAEAFDKLNGAPTDTVTFASAQAQQIHRVLRLAAGDQVIVLNGDGDECLVRFQRVQAGETTGIVERRTRNAAEPVTAVHLFQGLLKGAKLELVLQKCTEIGVRSFTPMATSRSVPAEPSSQRQRRYQTIVREAAEQCGRGLVPLVHQVTSFEDAVTSAVTHGPILVLWEQERATNLLAMPEVAPLSAMSLFVGPEGGFSPAEIAYAREAGGRTISLGPRILRAETAAMVGAALVLARLGEMG